MFGFKVHKFVSIALFSNESANKMCVSSTKSFFNSSFSNRSCISGSLLVSTMFCMAEVAFLKSLKINNVLVTKVAFLAINQFSVAMCRRTSVSGNKSIF